MDLSAHIKVNTAAVQTKLNFRVIHHLAICPYKHQGLVLPSLIKIENRQNLALKKDFANQKFPRI